MPQQELRRRAAARGGSRVEVDAAAVPRYAAQREAKVGECTGEDAQHLPLRSWAVRGGLREREAFQKLRHRSLVFAKVAQHLLRRLLHANDRYCMKSAGNGNELLSATRA